MKKYLLAGVVSVILGTSLANAADGTITFNGMVTASACTAITGVSANGAAPSANANVSLPNITDSTLNALTPGSYIGQTGFSILLTGCQAAAPLGNVRTAFTAAVSPASDPYVMGNTAVGGDTNVAVAILTPGGAQVDLNGGSHQDPGAVLPATSGPITLSYMAAYKPLTNTVLAGPVTGTAEYIISYY
ncbi:fimbrial adhesion protein [Buttiauxella gaviniae ATCC 51604]|uniref:Fimbrial adhesion protein n=1 Tax=Buttiauxella gaviniae ATCC 51604 TaxID=1354253 RepID=A0A1B7HNB8_9ENTR|nr:fimbrial protein [Buttiauxella gaviniae]OAT17132.1 fimbrial adhesion protein [Buttiauxella gaviniae ATCC 51604]